MVGYRLMHFVVVMVAKTYNVLQKKWTPLHLAARNGHVLVVKSLIKSGADVKVVEEVKLFICLIINITCSAHYYIAEKMHSFALGYTKWLC